LKAQDEKAPSLLLALTELPRTFLDVGMLGSTRFLPQKYPTGDGHGVLVIPGFLGDDLYNRMLINFLKGLGYQAIGWGQGRNLGPSGELLDGMMRQLEALAERTQGKVSVIGHSLGGIYAREIARARPDIVRQVVSLGSPINDNGQSTAVTARLYRLLNGRPAKVNTVRSKPPSVPISAVYTKTDGVVFWQKALQYDGHEQCENIEVLGSHCGLTWNFAVNHLLADRLAQDEGSWQPFRQRRLWRLVFPDNRRDLTALGLNL